MPEAIPAAPESREIRVFLSSTFRDFMEVGCSSWVA